MEAFVFCVALLAKWADKPGWKGTTRALLEKYIIWRSWSRSEPSTYYIEGGYIISRHLRHSQPFFLCFPGPRSHPYLQAMEGPLEHRANSYSRTRRTLPYKSSTPRPPETPGLIPLTMLISALQLTSHILEIQICHGTWSIDAVIYMDISVVVAEVV